MLPSLSLPRSSSASARDQPRLRSPARIGGRAGKKHHELAAAHGNLVSYWSILSSERRLDAIAPSVAPMSLPALLCHCIPPGADPFYGRVIAYDQIRGVFI